MLTELWMKNFKAWADPGRLRLAPLTGLFGPNSSGKSSLQQMLLLLKQTAESRDRNLVLKTGAEKDNYVNLGTIPDLIFGQQQDVMLGMSWTLSTPIQIGRSSVSALAFETEIYASPTENWVRHFEYSGKALRAGMKRRSDGYYDVEVEIGGRTPKKQRGRPPYVSAPVKCYGFSDEALRVYQDTGFLNDLVLSFEKCLQNVFYLGPLRDEPQRIYNWAGERPYDVGKRGELAIPALLAQGNGSVGSRKARGKKRSIQEQVAEWLVKMGMAQSFRTHKVTSTQYEVRLKRHSGSHEVLITDMGFGVSQVLPVLVLCQYCPEGATLILEQPEIHLHPAAQSVLADVLIDAVKNRNVQIIFESHSEHLLRRLQLRIAEGKVKPDDTALYFCEIGEERSSISLLNVDLFGNIRNWPKDFFGDLTGDLVSMAEANINRQP